VNVDTIDIRPARANEASLVLEMLRATAVEQGNEHELCVDLAAVREDGFGSAPRFQTLIAECDGRPAGLAVYFFNYSTWISRNGLYLEDLYVRPEFRRRGVAKALMARLQTIASEHECGRVQWLVLRHNTAAVKLYESLGAHAMPEWQVMMLREPLG
jgi:GNAT superfamily N-acetyltransferase